MSAALKNMLDAIFVGLAGGALMALVLELSGKQKLGQNISESFTRETISVSLHIRLIVAMFKPERF